MSLYQSRFNELIFLGASAVFYNYSNNVYYASLEYYIKVIKLFTSNYAILNSFS